MATTEISPTLAAGLLAAARLEAGLSQQELADAAGTSAPTISAYESGAKEPRLSTLERLLTAAGFELRIGFEPIDPSQDALARWEAALPAETRARWRRDQRRRIARDRRALARP